MEDFMKRIENFPDAVHDLLIDLSMFCLNTAEKIRIFLAQTFTEKNISRRPLMLPAGNAHLPEAVSSEDPYTPPVRIRRRIISSVKTFASQRIQKSAFHRY